MCDSIKPVFTMFLTDPSGYTINFIEVYPFIIKNKYYVISTEIRYDLGKPHIVSQVNYQFFEQKIFNKKWDKK
jgi:hypothetical protein